jgi:hypothetical protein
MRTLHCYERGRFPAQQGPNRQWTLLSVDQQTPLFTVANPTTYEKWYAVPVSGRMHIGDVRTGPDSMVESPWQDLMFPHHVRDS